MQHSMSFIIIFDTMDNTHSLPELNRYRWKVLISILFLPPFLLCVSVHVHIFSTLSSFDIVDIEPILLLYCIYLNNNHQLYIRQLNRV